MGTRHERVGAGRERVGGQRRMEPEVCPPRRVDDEGDAVRVRHRGQGPDVTDGAVVRGVADEDRSGVRGGREPSADLVDEFVRRYRLIGGSPLIPATRAQAAALESAIGWPVEVGMRFSEPSIEAGLRALSTRGVARVAAITLSP